MLYEARRANIGVVLHSNDFNFMQTMGGEIVYARVLHTTSLLAHLSFLL